MVAEQRNRTLVCKDCGVEPRAVEKSGKLQSYCKPCRAKRANARYLENRTEPTSRRVRDPNYIRRRNLAKYGLTIAEYEAMLISQDYRCAICRLPETHVHGTTKKVQPLSVDHDHATGRVRGLLCHACNITVGTSREDIRILLATIEYLQEHEEKLS